MYKLLIADDEELERQALRLFVEESDMDIDRIYESSSGIETVRICLLERPDIILLDINMPGISGLEVLEKIRVADKKSKVIISSAYNYFEYAKKAMQLGTLDFLVKPVNKTILIGALNRAVDELDAEMSAENHLSRLDAMMAAMEGRIAGDLTGGAISNEALYYLETIGLRSETSGATFHIRQPSGTPQEKTLQLLKKIKSVVALLDVPSMCAAGDDRISVIVFAKSRNDGSEMLKKIDALVQGAVQDFAPLSRLGEGSVFSNIEEIRQSYAEARKEAGDPIPQPESDPFDKDTPQAITKIRTFVEENYFKKIGLDDIAEAVGGSKFHMCRLFKQNTGTTIGDYLAGRRIGRAKELLKEGSFSIKQISGMVGYSDPNYFTWAFKKSEGISPVKYRYSNS